VRLVVAGVEDDEIGRIAVILGKGTIEHGSDIGFTRCINTEMLGASAFSNNRPRDVLDLINRTPGNDDVVTFARETPQNQQFRRRGNTVSGRRFYRHGK